MSVASRHDAPVRARVVGDESREASDAAERDLVTEGRDATAMLLRNVKSEESDRSVTLGRSAGKAMLVVSGVLGRSVALAVRDDHNVHNVRERTLRGSSAVNVEVTVQPVVDSESARSVGHSAAGRVRDAKVLQRAHSGASGVTGRATTGLEEDSTIAQVVARRSVASRTSIRTARTCTESRRATLLSSHVREAPSAESGRSIAATVAMARGADRSTSAVVSVAVAGQVLVVGEDVSPLAVRRALLRTSNPINF